MTALQTINILLVDDHEVIRIGLKSLFESQPDFKIVGQAASAEEAISAVAKHKPHVVVMDVRLPKENGFHATRIIKNRYPAVRVVVLTAFVDPFLVDESLRSGVDGYLLKEVDSDWLCKSVRKIAEGHSILDPAVTKMVMQHSSKDAHGGPLNRLSLLSDQERRVLELVADGKTNKEIAIELNLSDKTVKNYFSNVLDKLNLSRRTQAAVYFTQNSMLSAKASSA